MSAVMLWLTPFLVLVLVAVFARFTGCGRHLGGDDEIPLPERKHPPEETQKPPTPAGQAYIAEVQKATGFAALWPLNEVGGSLADEIGSLNADGTYTTAAGTAGSGFSLGKEGSLFHKDSKDFAPEFDGTAGHIDVPFKAQLNPVNSSFSIELWVKPTPNTGPQTQVLVSSHRFDSASKQQGYEIALISDPSETNQEVRARTFAGGTIGEVSVQPFGTEDPAEWRHIVMTYEGTSPTGGNLSLLVRVAKTNNPYNAPAKAVSYEAVTSMADSTLRFAACHEQGQSAENFFAGRIDNVAFYNGVLAQADIDKHFGMF